MDQNDLKMLRLDKTFSPSPELLQHMSAENVKRAIQLYQRMLPEKLEDYCYSRESIGTTHSGYALANKYIADWVHEKRLLATFHTFTRYAKKLSPHVQKILAIYLQEISKKSKNTWAHAGKVSPAVLDIVFEPILDNSNLQAQPIHRAISEFLGFFNESTVLTARSKRHLKKFADKLTSPKLKRSATHTSSK